MYIYIQRNHNNKQRETTMVVVTMFNTSLSSLQTLTNPHHIYSLTCKTPTKPTTTNNYRASSSKPNGVLIIRSYMEESSSVSGFANKVIGALPVIGLVARIFSDVGGVGGDLIDFAEFRRRVGNNSSVEDSRAFFEFQERRGKQGEPLYVLLCCWLAAVGVGLLKSEEILEGVVRLRISNDIEFEEETFLAIMNEAREKRAKLGVSTPTIPMEARAEKALEAIHVCCFGRDLIEERDEELLCTMLKAVFPSIMLTDLKRIVKEKADKVGEGSEDSKYTEIKTLSKEAVKLQMKDLRFLQQKSDS